MIKEEPIIIKADKRDYRVHQLKTVEPYFTAVKSGDKTFEIRKFDRDYQVGDFLCLTKYNPETNRLGEVILKRVSYMLTDQPYVPKGYVALGIVDDTI